MSVSEMSQTSIFFYGTLMHPKILKRVIRNDGVHLQLCSALLLEHTRHKVKDEDYPGIVPYSRSRKLFDRDLEEMERTVRGTLVTGFTAQDVAYLDFFEGNEYTREHIEVYPLEPLSRIPKRNVEDNDFVEPPPLASLSNLPAPVTAVTYIYVDLENLEAQLWSFDDFVKESARKWYDASDSHWRSQLLAMEHTSAFFYGTLMHPKILKRVIRNDGTHLQICPALLLDYTRHKVKYADYPGIVPYTKSRELFDRDLNETERNVRGTLVTGLTAKDMAYLDIFEGSQYTSERVEVYPLGASMGLSNYTIEDHPSTPPAATELQGSVEAVTYVYRYWKNLEAELWSFEKFVTESAWKWH